MAKAKPKAATKDKPAGSANLPAMADAERKALSTAVPEGMKAVRVVTLPSLAFKTVGVGYAVQFLEKMRESKVITKTADGTPQKPATIARGATVPDGAMYTLIVPAVVKDNLERDYPDDGYVGKAFYIVNMGKRKEGQKYNDFAITEVAPA